MIVLKHNDVIYIAKARCLLDDIDAVRNQVLNEQNVSMWHPGKRKNRLIATTSNGRFPDAIRYEKIFPQQLDKKNLLFESYKKMAEISKTYELAENDSIPQITVFAEADRAFCVYRDGAIIELENIYCDSFENEAVMALYDIKEINNPYEFFKEAYKIIEEMRWRVMFPIVVMNTKDNKIEVINR